MGGLGMGGLDMNCDGTGEPRRTSAKAWAALVSGILSGFAVLISLFLIIDRAEGQGAAGQVTAEQAIGWLDKNGDGKCDLQEYLGFQVTKIAQFDGDGDAMLNVSEFRDSLEGEGKRNARRSFLAFDREDEQGKLTRREFLGYHAYVFNTFVDTDKDGFMSTEEWAKIVGR